MRTASGKIFLVKGRRSEREGEGQKRRDTEKFPLRHRHSLEFGARCGPVNDPGAGAEHQLHVDRIFSLVPVSSFFLQ